MVFAGDLKAGTVIMVGSISIVCSIMHIVVSMHAPDLPIFSTQLTLKCKWYVYFHAGALKFLQHANWRANTKQLQWQWQ